MHDTFCLEMAFLLSMNFCFFFPFGVVVSQAWIVTEPKINSSSSSFRPVSKNVIWERRNDFMPSFTQLFQGLLLAKPYGETKIYSWVFCLQGVYSSAGYEHVINSMSLYSFFFCIDYGFITYLIINFYPQIKTPPF